MSDREREKEVAARRGVEFVQDGMLLGVVGIRDVMGSLLELVWRERDGRARDTARELLRR